MIGEKRTYRANEELPSCVTGVAPSHINPSKKQATGRDIFKVASNIETDANRLESRLKQIQYGKNTIGYDNYTATVPKKKRRYNISEHPRTPDPYEIQSKRAFEGRIKIWRRALHLWDTKDPSDVHSPNSAADRSSLDSVVALVKKESSTESRKSDYNNRSDNNDDTSSRIRPDNNHRNANSTGSSSGSQSDKQRKTVGGKDDDTRSGRGDDTNIRLKDNHKGSDEIDDSEIDGMINHDGDSKLGDTSQISSEMVMESADRKSGDGDDCLAIQGPVTYGVTTKTEEELVEAAFYLDCTPSKQKTDLDGMDSPDCVTSGPEGLKSIFDDEGPVLILNEDSMQSVDYEQGMLNQHFNSDTVDVLDALDEDDDEDIL